MHTLYYLGRLYAGTMAVNLAMLAVMIRAYPEPFSLAGDPFSWLGKLVTANGYANTGSFLLFTLTLLFNAFVWQKVLALIAHRPVWKHPAVRLLGWVVLAGFFLTALPCDRFDGLHSTGAGLVVGGLWIYSTILLYRSRNTFEARVNIMLQLVLHLAALFCGFNFILDSALKGFSQRPLLTAIIAVNGICLRTRLQSAKEPVVVYRESRLLHN